MILRCEDNVRGRLFVLLQEAEHIGANYARQLTFHTLLQTGIVPPRVERCQSCRRAGCSG
jgi:hypothetical protein